MAKSRGLTLSQYLSQIINFNSFKNVLREVFSLDSSLANYVDGMKNRDFRLFFQRPIIQEIIEANREKEEERIEEEIIPAPPVDVEQVKKEVRVFFRAKYKEKKTGKIRRTVGYVDEITIRGKKQKRLRDSKGRFVARY